jgi:hypothetical protein
MPREGNVVNERAMELATYLNITTEKWKRTQYEPVDANLMVMAVAYLLVNQTLVLGNEQVIAG